MPEHRTLASRKMAEVAAPESQHADNSTGLQARVTHSRTYEDVNI